MSRSCVEDFCTLLPAVCLSAFSYGSSTTRVFGSERLVLRLAGESPRYDQTEDLLGCPDWAPVDMGLQGQLPATLILSKGRQVEKGFGLYLASLGFPWHGQECFNVIDLFIKCALIAMYVLFTEPLSSILN